MKNRSHIIGNTGFYGLADDNNYEIVECVYDRIKLLTNGK